MFKAGRLIIGLALVLGLFASNRVWAQDCARADRLFKASQNMESTEQGRLMLEKAIALCPGHWQSLNNLGLYYETRQKWLVAGSYYQKARKANPAALAPLAGLGDVAYAMGNFKQAIRYYQLFLEGLRSGGEDLDPFEIASHEKLYAQKLDDARMRLDLHKKSMQSTVGSEYITRGLKADALFRGKAGVRQRPRLALSSIHFAYDSAGLDTKSLEQIRELARALNGSELKGREILIEGHTDSFGSEAYNLELSLKRAASVKMALVEMGVDSARLQIKGRGESRLLKALGSREEQAPNRRVEFVNLGGTQYISGS